MAYQTLFFVVENNCLLLLHKKDDESIRSEPKLTLQDMKTHQKLRGTSEFVITLCRFVTLSDVFWLYT